MRALKILLKILFVLFNIYCICENHSFTLYFKVLFMNAENESLQELQHIKRMMERSTKFSSLSGFSGVAAGICALLGVWFVVKTIARWKQDSYWEPGCAPWMNLATQC